jgi:hypothetical protein
MPAKLWDLRGAVWVHEIGVSSAIGYVPLVFLPLFAVFASLHCVSFRSINYRVGAFDAFDSDHEEYSGYSNLAL